MWFKWCCLIVTVVLPINGLASHLPCQGGESVRGLTELPNQSLSLGKSVLKSVSCCDDETICHGGLPLKGTNSFISPVGDSMFTTVRQYAQALESNDPQRHKRSINEERSLRLEFRCCPANMSVFFPLSAISALTGERVNVIQSPPLIMQPVVFGRCISSSSSLLDAECHQDLAPEMMHIGRINADSNDLEFFREAVMVESGCSCRLNPEPVDVIDLPDIDDTMTSFLKMWSD